MKLVAFVCFLLSLSVVTQGQLVTVFDSDGLSDTAAERIGFLIGDEPTLPVIDGVMFFRFQDQASQGIIGRSSLSSGLSPANTPLRNGTVWQNSSPSTAAVFKDHLYFNAGSSTLGRALYKYNPDTDVTTFVAAWNSDPASNAFTPYVVGVTDGGDRLWIQVNELLYYIEEDLPEWNGTIADANPFVTLYAPSSGFTPTSVQGRVVEHDGAYFFGYRGSPNTLYELGPSSATSHGTFDLVTKLTSTSDGLFFQCNTGSGDDACVFNGTAVVEIDAGDSLPTRGGCTPDDGARPVAFAEDAFGTVYTLVTDGQTCDGFNQLLRWSIKVYDSESGWITQVQLTEYAQHADRPDSFVYLAEEDRFYWGSFDGQSVSSWAPGETNSTVAFKTTTTSAVNPDTLLTNIFAPTSFALVGIMRAEVVAGEEGEIEGSGVLAGEYPDALVIFTPGFVPDEADGEVTEEDLDGTDEGSSLGPIIGGFFAAIGVGLLVGFAIVNQKSKQEGAKRLVEETKKTSASA